MPNPLLVNTVTLDSSLIRQQLDGQNASLVVFDCNEPRLLLNLKNYVSEGYLQTKRLIRNRVVCTVVGDETRESTHNFDELRLHHGL
jgi:hypothetical protein